jgi:hypothetical protein
MVRSPSFLIAAVLAAEIAVVPLPGFRVRPAPVLRGKPYERDRGQPASPDWTVARYSPAR